MRDQPITMNLQAADLRAAGEGVSGVRDYWALLKPNVMSLVVFSGAVGMFLAPGGLHPLLLTVTILCVAAAAGAAAAINNSYDADIDCLMARTRRRPAATIAFYVFVYTIWLKRRTPQNIVIGGAAGAFPPMIGWAAVTGDIGIASILLFLIIFVWTPPHFWALSLYRAGDYAKAGVPMLPVVAGPEETRRQILFYTLALAPLG